jgi:hypothetical protein
MFSLDYDVGVFEDLEERVTEPLSEFVERDKGFEA